MSLLVPHRPSPSHNSPGAASLQLGKSSPLGGQSGIATGTSSRPSEQEGGFSAQIRQPPCEARRYEYGRHEMMDHKTPVAPTTLSPEPLYLYPLMTK